MSEESTVEKIFAGTFTRTMDAKNRVSIPSDWPLTAKEPFYLLPSQDEKYLAAMLPTVFAAKRDEIRAKVPEEDWPEVRRVVFGTARLVSPDGQGRILIPDDFCKTVGLSGNAQFIGVTDSFEIWDPAKRDDPTTKPKLSTASTKALKNIGF